MTSIPKPYSWRLLAAVGLAAAVWLGSCIHWPGAPYTESAGSLAPDAAATLEAAHPGASLRGPVYRTRMETRTGTYRVASRTFLFEDAGGRTFRAHLDDDGRLTTSPATLVDALPPHLHARFFEGESGGATGGDPIVRRAWRFADVGAGIDRYELEFRIDGRGGFGSIDASGASRNATWLQGATTHRGSFSR